MRKRFIVEIGMGTDLHGQDVTKASRRAVRDAISRSCLCGLQEIVALPCLDDMVAEVKIATPWPDQVDQAAVLSEIPFGHKSIKVRRGRVVRSDTLDRRTWGQERGRRGGAGGRHCVGGRITGKLKHNGCHSPA